MYAAFYEVVRLACCVFIYWHKQYKKRPARSHRATTQHFGSVSRMFVAKAQGTGSNFTEMKSDGLKRRMSGVKREECETGRLTL
ncbi:hypothetical protein DJ535_02145 [Citrobacter murliniae]|uniref:Secreted protein n=1 Tax=Citrobacter murliniae TaxID=67829 RepID=A0ABY2Q0M0_9ENTR|nr:hypothetical protein DJ535_02145 [Citrobacter murliniae]